MIFPERLISDLTDLAIRMILNPVQYALAWVALFLVCVVLPTGGFLLEQYRSQRVSTGNRDEEVGA